MALTLIPRSRASHRDAMGAALVLACVVSACERQPVEVETSNSVMQVTQAATDGSVLAQVRAATAQFHQLENAIAAGYIRTSPCVFNTQGGKLIHYQKPPLVDAVVDPNQPEVLLYEPLKNGKLRLAGVEFLVPPGPWDALNSGPPMLGETVFMDRRLPPFGAPFPNYALYVWVWQHNPNGIYEQYNSNVSCEFADVAVIG